MKLFRVLLLSVCSLFLFWNPLYGQVGQPKAYDKAVVVAGEETAAGIGREILENGGNAVDAAVAVQFALAVTMPRNGNIGGGGFMVVHLKGDTTIALDFREEAPLKASRDMYLREGEYIPRLSRRGVLASGVPGVVDGMVKAVDRFGNLSLKSVMKPAIEVAREGYHLSWEQAQQLNGHAEVFKKYQGSRKYFTKSSGKRYREGDLFVQKDLARTLSRIAEKGREGFYAGKTADLLVQTMNRNDGVIGHKDLRTYESAWRSPVREKYRGYELNMMSPPSSGGIAIAQILESIEPYDLRKMGFNSARYIHLVTEAMRRAFADRAYFVGDPDFIDIPTDTLVSEGYNRRRMRSFSWEKASESADLRHGEIPEFSESLQTTHYSIVDKKGNAVAVTTTLNGYYGCKVAVDGAGFLLNNEMDDFTAKPGEPNMYGLIQGKSNAIEPGKRMLSSMTPTIVTKDGLVRMVLGAAGGPHIIPTAFMSFLNLAVYKMNAQQAISAPRFHHQWMPDKLYYEVFGVSSDTKEQLEAKGHKLVPTEGIGRGHIIFVDKAGNRHGAPDPRGNGVAEGY